MIARLLPAALLAVLLAACSSSSSSTPSHQRDISRTDLGDNWPLTVDRGTLECRDGSSVVFTVGGTTYAVNGTAKGAHRYAEIDAIWSADPNVAGLKKNIGPLIDKGLALC